MFLPSELAWAASVVPVGLSSSEVDEEEEAKEWDSFLRFKAGPVQLSKYLENKEIELIIWKQLNAA